MIKRVVLISIAGIVAAGIWFIVRPGSSLNNIANTVDNVVNKQSVDGMVSKEVSGYADYSAAALASSPAEKNVLFFHAEWCPTCRALEKSITSGNIPSGIRIFKVSYDTESALKQRYGVTYQHTLVQVKADGSAVIKFVGSPTLDDLIASLQ